MSKEMEDLSRQAIALALQGKWQQALDVNLQIIDQFGEGTDSLNRISRCYTELGEVEKARKHAEKVVSMDPHNAIAQKCLVRLEVLKDGSKITACVTSANLFLEEPGKTKIVPLVKLAEPSLLLTLACGHEVILEIHKHHIDILSVDQKYLGKLPDDVAHRIIKLSESGNEYKAFVKTSAPKELKVFIRETKRAKEILHITSFPTEKFQYIAFVPPKQELNIYR